VEGENSTSGPQPYQPYEAEVTNSPISNTKFHQHSILLEDEVIWGILVYGVEAVRSLSRSEQVKTLLAGPSPISPMKAEITISPISNRSFAPIMPSIIQTVGSMS
jgi:hypothetical protein